MTTTFILSVDSTPAAYNNDNENPTITKNADASDEDFADYINSITSVSVNGKSYAASGRGATKLINTDGTLITEAAAFTDGTSFDIVVTSTDIRNLSLLMHRNTNMYMQVLHGQSTGHRRVYRQPETAVPLLNWIIK